jgi:hypothetical protein
MELKLANQESSENNSPLRFLTHLSRKYPGFDRLEISRYVSGGQGKTLSRKIELIPFNVLIDSTLTKILGELSIDEELAVHSNIFKKNVKHCIPLIDFAFIELDQQAESMLHTIKIYFNADIYLFKSGRSFHGYVLKIINQTEWRVFLGKLLLFNQPNFPNQYVDSRWIGHSLEQNFSALRLSLNSNFYIQEPTFIQVY